MNVFIVVNKKRHVVSVYATRESAQRFIQEWLSRARSEYSIESYELIS